MAGSTLEAVKSKAYCASEKAKDDKGCDYGQQSKRKPISEVMLKKIGLLQRDHF
jgi:hypothetical protein